MAFFMISFEQAKSSQAKRNKGYQDRLARNASKLVTDGAEEWTQSPDTFLYSRIYYFHRGNRTVDADNINKPVLDALKGIVFADDSQIIWLGLPRLISWQPQP